MTPTWNLLTARPGQYQGERTHSDVTAFAERQRQRMIAAQSKPNPNVRTLNRRKHGA